MTRTLHYDAVVVGAGVHGLVAGTRLAQAGASVCVLTQGHGGTHLSPATIDEPLDPAASGWLTATVAAGPFGGYEYLRVPEGLGLPTALGTRKRVTLAPSTMVAGAAAGAVAIVGGAGLRDFQAGLCAANLAAGGVAARGLEFDWRLDRADANSVQVARRFDDTAWRAWFLGTLEPLLTGADAVIGLPAVIGLRDPGAIHAELERRLGRPVFEIPTLPPSVPGIRLFEILRTALRAAGGRLVVGPRVEVGATTHAAGQARIRSVRAASAGEHTTYAADAFIFATGEDAVTNGQALARGYRAVEVLA